MQNSGPIRPSDWINQVNTSGILQSAQVCFIQRLAHFEWQWAVEDIIDSLQVLLGERNKHTFKERSLTYDVIFRGLVDHIRLSTCHDKMQLNHV
jgi:hypothetical protein